MYIHVVGWCISYCMCGISVITCAIWCVFTAESCGSWQPTNSLFSPLTCPESPPPVSDTTDHTPSNVTPPLSSSDHTPSPLTIEAREVGPGVLCGGREKNSPQLVGGTPQRPGTSTPSDTPHGSSGHVKIKISARRVREVPSPLLLTPLTRGPLRGEADSPDSHVSGDGSESSTPRALVHQTPHNLSLPSPSPSPSPSASQDQLSQGHTGEVSTNPPVNDGELVCVVIFSLKHTS